MFEDYKTAQDECDHEINEKIEVAYDEDGMFVECCKCGGSGICMNNMDNFWYNGDYFE